MKSRFFRRRATRACHLVYSDLARVEPLRRSDHLVDRLFEIRCGLSLKAQRVDAGDDERLEVRALEPALLQRRDRRIHRIVQLQQLPRALATNLDRPRQLGAEELVAALEDRVEGAAGEPPILLIAEAKRDEGCF